jgi:uncharacterized protein YjdB
MKTLRQRALSPWVFAVIAAIIIAGLVFPGCRDVNHESENVPVIGVELNETTLELELGETATLSATVHPGDASNKKVTWFSSDEEVATVTGDPNTGIATVCAVGAGNATITVTTVGKKADGTPATATCELTVNPIDPGIHPGVIEVSGIRLDKTEITLAVEDTATLTATVEPSNATYKNVTWFSSDTGVAAVSVEPDGVATVFVDPFGVATVTAVSEGTATITVTPLSNSLVTASCTVSVTPASGPVAVTGVTLNEETLELEEGNIEVLTATVAPGNATNKNVSWKSSDDAVATVTPGAGGTATVTAVSEGSAIITVTTMGLKEDETPATAFCTVTVIPANPDDILVTGVTLAPTSLDFILGDEPKALTATIKPDNATNTNVSWSSTNSSVASVANGTVTAHAVGTATITVTTQNGGHTASCAVSVKPVPVTEVTLDKTSLNVAVNFSEDIKATVLPTNTPNKNISLVSSSDTSVATVTFNAQGNARITGVSAGTATITVTTEGLKADGQPATKTCAVTVYTVAVSGVTLTKDTITLVKDRTETLSATIAPDNATNQNVIWTSSDDNVATVSVNATTGVATVTGVTVGTATITVTTADGGHKATCAVIVHSAGTNDLLGKTYNIGAYTTTYNANLTYVTTSTGNPKNEFEGTYTYDSTEKTLVTTTTRWRQDNGAWKTESEASWNEKDWFPTRTFKYVISGNYILAQQVFTNSGTDELKGKTYMRTVGVQNRPYVFSEDGTCSYTSNNQAVIAAYYYDSTTSAVWLRPITIAGKTMLENFTGSNASATNSTYASLRFVYDADPNSWNYLKLTQETFQTDW